MTDKEGCAPCAQNHLNRLSNKWLASNGEDLTTEGFIIKQCMKMGIDNADHMEKLKEKLEKFK